MCREKRPRKRRESRKGRPCSPRDGMGGDAEWLPLDICMSCFRPADSVFKFVHGFLFFPYQSIIVSRIFFFTRSLVSLANFLSFIVSVSLFLLVIFFLVVGWAVLIVDLALRNR